MAGYQHDFDNPLINNLHTSMELVDGIPHQRVTLGSDNITITGNVNVATEIRVNNTDLQSIPVRLTTTPNVNVNNWPATQTVTGSVSISALPEVEVKNDSGNPLSISKNTSANSTSNRIYVSQETDAVLADSNYFFNVARGMIPGHATFVRNAFNPSVPQDTETSVWVEGGIYPHGAWTTAQKLYVISTAAGDAGKQILVEGLDASYNLQSEYVTCNGLTAVATANDFIRIHTATVVSSSNNSANAGEITFRLTSGTGTVVAHIRTGFGITKLSQYTVPAGKTAYILYGAATSFRGGSGNIGSQIRMMVRPYGGSFVCAYIAEVVNGQYRDDFPAPLKVPEKADIDVRCLADSNGSVFSATYAIVLIDN